MKHFPSCKVFYYLLIIIRLHSFDIHTILESYLYNLHIKTKLYKIRNSNIYFVFKLIVNYTILPKCVTNNCTKHKFWIATMFPKYCNQLNTPTLSEKMQITIVVKYVRTRWKEPLLSNP